MSRQGNKDRLKLPQALRYRPQQKWGWGAILFGVKGLERAGKTMTVCPTRWEG